VNRFGKALIAVLVLAVAALATMVRFVDTPSAPGSTASPASSGPLLIPVPGVRSADLVDSFDDPRGGGTRAHHAIDIMAPAGTPIRAAASGSIEKLHNSPEGGLMVYQRTALDRVVYYGHLARYAPGLAEGQAINAGAPIGFVGASGDADPGAPHLHFGVKTLAPGEGWWRGRDIDPYPLLAGSPPAR
jgi:peptidoglycan LD-endopeptidase LytH